MTGSSLSLLSFEVSRFGLFSSTVCCLSLTFKSSGGGGVANQIAEFAGCDLISHTIDHR